MQNNIEIQHLPAQEKRVETGVVKFGDDWSGIFIRGDDCFNFLFGLLFLLSKVKFKIPETAKYLALKEVKSYMNILNDCNQNEKMRVELAAEIAKIK